MLRTHYLVIEAFFVIFLYQTQNHEIKSNYNT